VFREKPRAGVRPGGAARRLGSG